MILEQQFALFGCFVVLGGSLHSGTQHANSTAAFASRFPLTSCIRYHRTMDRIDLDALMADLPDNGQPERELSGTSTFWFFLCAWFVLSVLVGVRAP